MLSRSKWYIRRQPFKLEGKGSNPLESTLPRRDKHRYKRIICVLYARRRRGIYNLLRGRKVAIQRIHNPPPAVRICPSELRKKQTPWGSHKPTILGAPPSSATYGVVFQDLKSLPSLFT